MADLPARSLDGNVLAEATNAGKDKDEAVKAAGFDMKDGKPVAPLKPAKKAPAAKPAAEKKGS